MRNIKIVLQYEGTRYQGWQRQETSDNTIQGKLEVLLSRMCGEKIEIQGSGRTDAGVHARGQIVNFHTHSTMELQEMFDYMNRYLPEDIGVTDIREVPERFHSRLNAKGKCYCYQVDNGKTADVFSRRYALHVPDMLDMAAMENAARYLCGEHDFQAFTSAKKGKKSTIRRIESIEIERKEDKIFFWFKGNGFLYHMVRILMGTLLEVGLGQRTADGMQEILQSGKRENAGYLVPAKGLTLVEVYYE